MTLGHPREEQARGNPAARICEGEGRMAELLDHNLLPCLVGLLLSVPR